MAGTQTLLTASLLVVVLSVLPSFFSQAEAKFSLSGLSSAANLLNSENSLLGGSDRRQRLQHVADPCSGVDLLKVSPAHPCSAKVRAARLAVPRLGGFMKVEGGHAAGIGSHPPGVGSHPPGVGDHPPGVGHHPPGTGHHPPGVGHHPPGVGRHCNANASVCLDPNANTKLRLDPTATTCCSKTCYSLLNDNRHCGTCGTKCRRKFGQPGSTCCSGFCTDLQTNASHCGACSIACNAGQSCVAGVCLSYGR